MEAPPECEVERFGISRADYEPGMLIKVPADD